MNPKPTCIIITGQPGAGKSTLAGKIAPRLHLPRLSRDELKEGYVNTFGKSHSDLPNDTNKKVSRQFFSTVEEWLRADISLLIEAAFQHNVWLPAVTQWAQIAQIIVILCHTDPKLTMRRRLDRQVEDATRIFYHGETPIAHSKASGQRPPRHRYVEPKLDVPTLTVDTTDQYRPNIETIIQFIKNHQNGDDL